MAVDDNEALDASLREERSLTIEQFCFLESIGKNSFYKMKKRGTAPES